MGEDFSLIVDQYKNNAEGHGSLGVFFFQKIKRPEDRVSMNKEWERADKPPGIRATSNK